jgi:CIC family chloride channel protein
MKNQVFRLFHQLRAWRMRHISNRNFLIFLAILVGVIGGLAAALLKGMTHFIAAFLQEEVQWQYKFYLYLLFPTLGILLSVMYVRKFIRTKKMAHGMTPIIYAISRKSSRIEPHNMYSQIITSAMTIGFGGSAGLEAPIANSGSAIGSNVGRFFGLSYREVTLLLSCGAAAGIAGAFNSPVAGMIFAIEILLPEFSIPLFIPLLLSAATASVISRLLYSEPLFYLLTEEWSVHALGYYVLLAVIIGFFSVYFSKLSNAFQHWYAKIKNAYHKVWISGLSLGVLIFLFPALYGEGYLSIQKILDGDHASLLEASIFDQYADLGYLIVLYALVTVFAKSFASLITLQSGGNGGVFGPSLIMGGLLGFAFAYGLNLTGLVQLNVANFVVAGMAAALSGIMHAPLTAIFLIAEITGGYLLMVPLMLVTSISYWINRRFMKYSIYTKVLAESGDLLTHEDKDKTVLSRLSLDGMIEKNFTILHLNDNPFERRYDIIHTKRNIFPVIDDRQKLVGIVYSGKLFEILLGESQEKEFTIAELKEEPMDVLLRDTPMDVVMHKMNKEDIWILPVVDQEGQYLGFVSKSAIFNKYRSLLKMDADFIA